VGKESIQFTIIPSDFCKFLYLTENKSIIKNSNGAVKITPEHKNYSEYKKFPVLILQNKNSYFDISFRLSSSHACFI
jgi:hypothetical protein